MPRDDSEVFSRAPGKSDARFWMLDASTRFFTSIQPLVSSICFAERSHSGLVHRSRKPEWGKLHRGFKSHPLRQQNFGLRIADCGFEGPVRQFDLVPLD